MSDEHTPAFPVSSREIFYGQGSTNFTTRMTLSPEVHEADGCDDTPPTWTQPPWQAWIETTGDALLVFEAARRGVI